jgi:hypothetical protein
MTIITICDTAIYRAPTNAGLLATTAKPAGDGCR